MTESLLHLELHHARRAELQREAERSQLARTAKEAAAAAGPAAVRLPVVRPRPALPH